MRTDHEGVYTVALAHIEDAVSSPGPRSDQKTPRLGALRVDVDARGGHEAAARTDAEAVDAGDARGRGVEDRAAGGRKSGEQSGAQRADQRETRHMGCCL